MPTIRWLVGCLLAVPVVVPCDVAFGQIHAGTYPVPAVTSQIIKAFDNPEGAIFSADGRFVFVTNAAEIGANRAKDFAFTEGAGYISKLEVLPAGELKMVNKQLIAGLTGPLGMGVLPVATRQFPAGTIFACVGSAPMRDSSGELITDPKRLRTQLLAFDVDGKTLGALETGEGSIFQQTNGSPILLINALSFDKSGNLYVADTGFGGGQFNPPFTGKGGLWMIPHGALDDLASGKTPGQKPVFLAVPGHPDGVEVSPRDGKIYVNTVGPVAGAPDPAGGGIYALTVDDIKNGRLPDPVDRDLGALDGLAFTTGGTMLNTQIRGDRPASILVNCPGQRATILSIQPTGTTADLTGPADLAVRRLAGGTHLVVVPELFAQDSTPGDDEVTVLVLPANFDAACGR
jgi:sugar lactone lactonase YvrE